MASFPIIPPTKYIHPEQARPRPGEVTWALGRLKYRYLAFRSGVRLSAFFFGGGKVYTALRRNSMVLGSTFGVAIGQK
jgi:hypothetical protein